MSRHLTKEELQTSFEALREYTLDNFPESLGIHSFVMTRGQVDGQPMLAFYTTMAPKDCIVVLKSLIKQLERGDHLSAPIKPITRH